MIGIGGIAGLLFVLSNHFSVDISVYLVSVIFLSGFLAWARLSLGAHKPSQVYSGFALGWLAVALCISIFFNH
jgi:membrane-associated phospholipid phosphatase